MGGDRGHLLPLYALFALLVWPLAAFGGRSASTAIPFGLTCLVFAVFYLQRDGRVGFRLGNSLDRALVALLAVVALQLIPLPARIAGVLSPHAEGVRSTLALDRATSAAFHPLTISSSDTVWAWIVTAGAVAIFWVARARFRHGGVRHTVRMVSALGFAVSLLAIAQAATAGRQHLLAVHDRGRRTAAIWAVRQPQSLRDVGDHGAAAVPRVHRRPHGRSNRRVGALQPARAAGACDRSANGVADGRSGSDARRAAAVAVAIGCAGARAVRGGDCRALPASASIAGAGVA